MKLLSEFKDVEELSEEMLNFKYSYRNIYHEIFKLVEENRKLKKDIDEIKENYYALKQKVNLGF